jgi:hypothetical protein
MALMFGMTTSNVSVMHAVDVAMFVHSRRSGAAVQ